MIPKFSLPILSLVGPALFWWILNMVSVAAT